MPIIKVSMLRFLVIFFVFSAAPLFSLDLPVAKISDDSLLRISLRESWLMESPIRVLSRAPSMHVLQTGERVQVHVHTERGSEEFAIIFSRELMRGRVATETAPAMPRRGTGQFPGWAQGSWMLRRRKDTGEGTLIRVFLRSDHNTFVQFRPFTPERSQMDVVVYGGYLVRSMPLPVSFERLYTMRVNDVLRLAGDRFPVRYFEPNPVYYRYSRRFVAQVRSHLGGLRFADDGGIDEYGNFVLIDSLLPQNPATAGLNCSGFAKWLIDGVLRPVTGKRLPITPLKQPFGERGSTLTAHWEALRDPFFGLDWIRNLASEANGVLRSDAFRCLDEFEVRSANFSTVRVSNTHRSFPGFFREAGFCIEGLLPLLYTLAIDEPFMFYLAAVNNEINDPTGRGGPRMRQYFHVAAFVPFFDEFGIFRVAVFESAAETSMAIFLNRYRQPRHLGTHVSLVQIPVPSAFDP